MDLFSQIVKEFLIEEKMPGVLYHATMKYKLPSIKKYGLGGKMPFKRYWDYEGTIYKNITRGVFLDEDADCAYDYVDTSDEMENYEEKYDKKPEIIVFEVSIKNLDLSKLEMDQNNLSNFDDEENTKSYFYKGIIPFQFLKRVK